MSEPLKQIEGTDDQPDGLGIYDLDDSLEIIAYSQQGDGVLRIAKDIAPDLTSALNEVAPEHPRIYIGTKSGITPTRNGVAFGFVGEEGEDFRDVPFEELCTILERHFTVVEPAHHVTAAVIDEGSTVEFEVSSPDGQFEPFVRHMSLPNLAMFVSKMLTKMPDSMEGLVVEPPAPSAEPMDNAINRQARALAEWAITVEQSVAHELRSEIDHFWDPESGLVEKAHNSLDNPDTWVLDTDKYAEKALVWWWALNSPAYGPQHERQREIVPAFERGHSGFSAAFTMGKARRVVTEERQVLETQWGRA